MKDDYKESNIGALFKNPNRTKERAPLLTGNMTLNRSAVKNLSMLMANDEPATLKLAAWKNISKKDGQSYYTVTAHVEAPVSTLSSDTEDDEIDL
jgi:UDP-N-acetylenolpyruvoylglucosamine reductase